MIGNYPAILAHPFQVGAGFLVARFGELCQAEDGHLTAFQREDALAGANADAQFLRLERLADEVVGAGVEALDDILRSPPRGQEDDVHISAGVAVSDVPAQLDARHFRHFPVGNDQAIRAAPQHLQGLATVAGRSHLVAEVGQRFGQHLRGETVVIYNEDSHGIGSRVVVMFRSAAINLAGTRSKYFFHSPRRRSTCAGISATRPVRLRSSMAAAACCRPRADTLAEAPLMRCATLRDSFRVP